MMNDENDYNPKMEGDAVEGTVECVCRGEVV